MGIKGGECAARRSGAGETQPGQRAVMRADIADGRRWSALQGGCGHVQVLDATGTIRYGRDMTVYVLATEQGILTDTAGPQQIKREQLARARAVGTRTEAEYEKALEQLQYGGAQESITVIVPSNVL